MRLLRTYSGSSRSTRDAAIFAVGPHLRYPAPTAARLAWFPAHRATGDHLRLFKAAAGCLAPEAAGLDASVHLPARADPGDPGH